MLKIGKIHPNGENMLIFVAIMTVWSLKLTLNHEVGWFSMTWHIVIKMTLILEQGITQRVTQQC